MEHITKDSFSYVGEDASKREAITRPSVTFMQDAMRRLRQNKVALVCAVAIVIMIVTSTVAPMLCPFDYREQHYSHTNAAMMTLCTDCLLYTSRCV